MISARAPGKIVVWGEYAVLADAPAGVMAVNRFANVTLNSTNDGWGFSASGFLTPGYHGFTDQFSNVPVCNITNAVLQHFGYDTYPEPFRLGADSRQFFDQGKKLGIGSSAAVCTATYHTLATLLGKKTCLDDAIDIHRNLQAGSGSGLDVASSWHGGMIDYRSGNAQPITWPQDIYWQAIWTGTVSQTTTHLASFSNWRQTSNTSSLDDLCAMSEQVSEHLCLTNLRHYADCLMEFDKSAQLNIFTQQHYDIRSIADRLGMVYKPCGAGGGDIGLVFAADPDFQELRKRVTQRGYTCLDLEIADSGIRVEQT